MSLSSDVELREALTTQSKSNKTSITFLISVPGESAEAHKAFVRADSDSDWVVIGPEDAVDEVESLPAAQAPKQEEMEEGSAGVLVDSASSSDENENENRLSNPQMALQTELADAGGFSPA